MPDIAMCGDDECALKESCYRYTATPSEYRQTWFFSSPRNEKECKFYWENNKENK